MIREYISRKDYDALQDVLQAMRDLLEDTVPTRPNLELRRIADWGNDHHYNAMQVVIDDPTHLGKQALAYDIIRRTPKKKWSKHDHQAL